MRIWKTMNFTFFKCVSEISKAFRLLSMDELFSGHRVLQKIVMTRNRFLSTLRYIRFSPPDLVRQDAPLTRLHIFMARIYDISYINGTDHVSFSEEIFVFLAQILLNNHCSSLRVKITFFWYLDRYPVTRHLIVIFITYFPNISNGTVLFLYNSNDRHGHASHPVVYQCDL